SNFAGGEASFDIAAQRYSSTLSLPPLSTPYVSALSQTRLSVTWPELQGYPGVNYQIYMDGNATEAATTTENMWVATSLAPSSVHSFRIGYNLSDGRRGPVSDATTAKTWGEDSNFDGLPDDWQGLYFGGDQTKWPNGSADSDGDGASNLLEFLAGTNPI